MVNSNRGVLAQMLSIDKDDLISAFSGEAEWTLILYALFREPFMVALAKLI